MFGTVCQICGICLFSKQLQESPGRLCRVGQIKAFAYQARQHQIRYQEGLRPNAVQVPVKSLSRIVYAMYIVDAADCYVHAVAWSVCVRNGDESCKNGCTDRDAVWRVGSGGLKYGKRVLDWWGVRIPQGKKQFWGEEGAVS